MKRIDPERLAALLLARLACGKPPREADARKSLYAVAARDCSASEWQEQFASALAQLRAAGEVQSDQLALTARGRARLAQALGLRSLPEATSWSVFRRKYLPRLFLALPESSAAPNCAAALLAERLGVPYDGRSTPARVADAWLASSLGLSKLSLDELRRKLLARELGLPERRTSAELLRLAATQLADAPKGDANSLLDALARRWLLEGATAPAREPAPRDAPAPAEALGRFVRRVQQAADSPEARHFGPEKVFIGSVWQALAAEPDMARLGENGFKRLLVEAHRQGWLVLAAADLVAAMDPLDVRSSETRHQNATYHFIQRGQPA
ncbi:MAG TPA: hypothetical protein VFS67_35290 [Polyangiaceae bacterium]|jgi:hypothetical protein|nr:hypothetical protein [Polyangiaceae bacterium]